MPRQKPARTDRGPVPRRGRVLPVLALLLCLAGVIRLASGVSEALAQDNAASPPAALPMRGAPADPPAGASPAQASAPRLTPEDHGENAGRIVAIARREQALSLREDALAERAQLLAAAQARLNEQIAALENAERALAATMALADRAAEDDITRLVAVFTAMKPEDASAVFAEMDPDFAAGFLGRLAPAVAAAVLAGLPPRQAYGLSAILAGRNALVPRD